MTNFELIETIRNAWGMSTHNHNRFAECISKISWEQVFTADGEWYYCLGDVTFITESLDPFAKTFSRPCFLVQGGLIEL